MKEANLSGIEIEVPGFFTRLVDFFFAPFHFMNKALEDFIPSLKKSEFIKGLLAACIVIYSFVAIVWLVVKVIGIIYVWVKQLLG